MDIGPLTAEQAIADTRRLMKEGFIVVTIEGAELESVWNFLFNSVEQSVSFKKSMNEIEALYQDGEVTNDVIQEMALNYKTVRYWFQTSTEAQKCRALRPTN